MCLAVGLGRGSGFQGLLSFDFIFFFHPHHHHTTPPILFSLFLSVRRGAGPEWGELWGWDRLCGSKVGGKGNGLILPTGEGREEKPGGPRVYNSYTFMAPCLSRSVLGFGSLKDLGKFSLFRQGVVVWFFFSPLHPCGFEAQQSAGMWLAGGFGVSRGCSPLLDAGGGCSHLVFQGHPGFILRSRSAPAAASASPAASGSEDLKFPVPSSSVSSSSSTDSGWGAGSCSVGTFPQRGELR